MLIGLNEYGIVNTDKPFIYTRDLSTCVVLILHRENDAVLMHIESFNDFIRFEYLFHDIKFIDVFKSQYTRDSDLENIIRFLDNNIFQYEINDVFVNYSNSTSVCYDYNYHKYYMFCDKCFIEREKGSVLRLEL